MLTIPLRFRTYGRYYTNGLDNEQASLAWQNQLIIVTKQHTLHELVAVERGERRRGHMLRYTTVVLVLLFSACGGEQQREKDTAASLNRQIADTDRAVATKEADDYEGRAGPDTGPLVDLPPPTAQEMANYKRAINCYTLANIMHAVGKVPGRAAAFKVSGAALEREKAQAILAGLTVGRTPTEVDTDYADEHIKIIDPLTTMSGDEGAAALNGFARQYADCL